MSLMDKNSFTKFTFDRNTFIGFDQEEIEKTSTNELLMVRKHVYEYLKSTKLKKRNANFIEVFKRINKELRTRNILPAKQLKEKRNGKEIVFNLIKKTRCSTNTDSISMRSDERSSSTVEKFKNSNKDIFLSHKNYLNIEIPNFFNDKKQKLDDKANFNSYAISNVNYESKNLNSNSKYLSNNCTLIK